MAGNSNQSFEESSSYTIAGVLILCAVLMVALCISNTLILTETGQSLKNVSYIVSWILAFVFLALGVFYLVRSYPKPLGQTVAQKNSTPKQALPAPPLPLVINTNPAVPIQRSPIPQVSTTSKPNAIYTPLPPPSRPVVYQAVPEVSTPMGSPPTNANKMMTQTFNPIDNLPPVIVQQKVPLRPKPLKRTAYPEVPNVSNTFPPSEPGLDWYDTSSLYAQ